MGITKKINKVVALAILGLGLGLAASSAQASLIGTTVDVAVMTYDGTTTTTLASTSVLVTNSTEISGGPVTIDIGGDSLSVVFNDTIPFPTDVFAGLAFLNINITTPAHIIAGFLGGDTNIAGFDASRIIHDDHNVGFNFESLTVNPKDYVNVQLDIQAVPEPTSVALLGMGMIGLVAVRRKKRS